ncbi:YobI family P-loop NTPase [Microbacterium lacticum]
MKARDNADVEVRRANRTKFFDIVIPIVPFITHRNARDLMLDAMKGTGVSRDLINVAARFVADMRLITNMRNEYDVYANRLLGTPNQMPGLDPDRLFALIIYKCVHMADFEAIRFGTSDLDRLHDAWRDIVNASLSAALDRERAATGQLSLDGILDGRAKMLGDRLEQVMHALPVNRNQPTHAQLTVNNQAHQGPQLRTRALWAQLATDRASATVSNTYSGQSMNLTFDQLQTLMGTRFNPSEWLAVDRQAEIKKQRSARREADFLRHHTWGDLYERREFTSAATDGTGPETFEQATERLLKSRLARALVAAGYINDYFALYVSVYYGEHLRPRALNYIVHALDRGVADIQYELDGDDVEAIIGDKGTDIFRDRAAYNINVLDHLLANRPNEAEMIVRQVAAWDRDDRDFGQAYIQSGTEPVQFVRRLAPLLPEAIADIVTDAPEEALAQLLDAALDYAGSDIGAPMSSEFARLVMDNYERFPSISTAVQDAPSLDPRKQQTIDAIAKLGIQLPATASLTPLARDRVIELGAYELNATNLGNLTGQPSLALDAIRAKSEAVYGAALGRMPTYLALVAEATAVTIENPAAFIPILNYTHEAAVDDKYLAQIVEMASEKCRVTTITDAPRPAWPTLAATKRMTPSAQNLLAYVDAIGALDDSASHLLTGVEAVEQPEEVSDTERVRLAVAILSAQDVIPSAAHRVQLAASLNLPSPIPTASLTPETGELLGLMIDAKLLSDDEATFSSTLIMDWHTREAALIRSTNASAFISPASLPPAELADFFRSGRVPKHLKDAVLAKLAVFIPGASQEAIRAVAMFAASSAADIPFAMIDQLRAGGASDQSIVALLANSQGVSLGEIQAELRVLGAPYPSIADRGTVRPLVPDDEAHRQLLDRLKAGDIVSEHKPDRGGRRVYLRRT